MRHRRGSTGARALAVGVASLLILGAATAASAHVHAKLASAVKSVGSVVSPGSNEEPSAPPTQQPPMPGTVSSDQGEQGENENAAEDQGENEQGETPDPAESPESKDQGNHESDGPEQENESSDSQGGGTSGGSGEHDSGDHQGSGESSDSGGEGSGSGD